MANDAENTYLITINELQARVKEQDAIIDHLKRQVRDGIFCGKQEIMQVFNWSEYTFGQFIKKGMPCRIDNRTYYAHRQNIEKFFIEYTKVSYKNAPDDFIDGNNEK